MSSLPDNTLSTRTDCPKVLISLEDGELGITDFHRVEMSQMRVGGTRGRRGRRGRGSRESVHHPSPSSLTQRHEGFRARIPTPTQPCTADDGEALQYDDDDQEPGL